MIILLQWPCGPGPEPSDRSSSDPVQLESCGGPCQAVPTRPGRRGGGAAATSARLADSEAVQAKTIRVTATISSFSFGGPPGRSRLARSARRAGDRDARRRVVDVDDALASGPVTRIQWADRR